MSACDILLSNTLNFFSQVRFSYNKCRRFPNAVIEAPSSLLSVAVTAAATTVAATIAVVATPGREREGTAGARGEKAIVIITFAIPEGDKPQR